MSDHTATVQALLERAGRTFSEQAGFTLNDKPRALFQLLVLSTLLAKPIQAEMAVRACAELRRAGGNTPDGMLKLTWQQRVDALGRAHYKRYDESTATRLGEASRFVLDRWHGDLRKLEAEADRSPRRAAKLLGEIPGIGPAGADIFLREAQDLWTWLRPYLDDRVMRGAQAVGLPRTRPKLAALFNGAAAASLAAALVRVTLDDELAETVRNAS